MDKLDKTTLRSAVASAVQLGDRVAIESLLLDEGLLLEKDLSGFTQVYNKIMSGGVISRKDFDWLEREIDRSLLELRFPSGDGFNINQLPATLDFLGLGVDVSVASTLCFLANFCSSNTAKGIAVITAVRNEAPWLMEWLAHYLCLGVDKIFVVHNDCDDGTDELLRCISLIDERVIVIENKVKEATSPQKKAFNTLTLAHPAVHNFEWIAFLDADELIWPMNPGRLRLQDNIDAICAAKAGSNIDGIQLHWRWFSSANMYAWENELVSRRFTRSRENLHTKPIVRASSLWSMEKIHFPTFAKDEFLVVNSAGLEVDKLREEISPASYDNLQLNHYFAKSFQEFSLKKRRGRGAVGKGEIQRSFDNFLWGAQGTSESTLPNTKLVIEVERQISLWLEHCDVASAAKFGTETSRRRVQELEQSIELKKIFDGLQG